MLKGKMSISRPQCSDGSKYISITIEDNLSQARFLDIQISYSNFSKCLTGLSECDCKLEIRALDKVGKKKESKPFEYEFKYKKYETKVDDAIEAGKKLCPNGWHLNTYFGSQNSFFTKDSKNYARTTISRWVDTNE